MDNQTQPKKKCTSCQSYFKKHWLLVVVSLYFAFAAVYGSIEIAKEVYSHFTH